jgi:hypothetical protein
MKHLDVRQPPALATHVAGHDAEPFGLDLTLAPDRMNVSDVRTPDAISEWRKDQPVAMQVRLDEEHGTTDGV